MPAGGTALAITLARNGHEVVLWGHDPQHIATVDATAVRRVSPPRAFSRSLHLESDLATALGSQRGYPSSTQPCLR
ncbi:hypothetical protein ACNKHV_22700 [Shigella flexneri]